MIGLHSREPVTMEQFKSALREAIEHHRMRADREFCPREPENGWSLQAKRRRAIADLYEEVLSKMERRP